MTQKLGEVLNDASHQLSQVLGYDAMRDAKLLISLATGIKIEFLNANLNQEFDPIQLKNFNTLLTRRIKREPMSHILGKRDFWKYEFIVTPDVLDPRPDTETLIEQALNGFSPKRILDLGTGSGCILLSLLSEWPNAQGIGVDLSENALEIARQNAESLGVADRCKLIQSDWFSGVSGKFDLIVSNPPYISEGEMAELEPEVKNFEPHMALTPGGDGLESYRIIAGSLKKFLNPNGIGLFEIGASQGLDMLNIFAENGFAHSKIFQDLDGRDRVVKVIAK